jgi:hypothetical protein
VGFVWPSCANPSPNTSEKRPFNPRLPRGCADLPGSLVCNGLAPLMWEAVPRPLRPPAAVGQRCCGYSGRQPPHGVHRTTYDVLLKPSVAYRLVNQNYATMINRGQTISQGSGAAQGPVAYVAMAVFVLALQPLSER